MEVEEVDIPEVLICPICKDLPKNEIYQCKNGHSICRECCARIKRCPRCKIPYANGAVRNLALQSLISSIKFPCPFKVYGCTQRMKRKEVTSHTKICRYNGKHVQVCKLIGYSCDFWSNAAHIDETILHLKAEHNLHVHTGSKASIKLRNVLSATKTSGEGKMREVLWQPILIECAFNEEGCSRGNLSRDTRSVKEQFIFLTQQHTADNTMSWIMLYLGEVRGEASRFMVEFEIKSYSRIGDFKWKTPCVGLLETRYWELRVPVTHLEKYFFKKETMQHDFLALGFRILKGDLDLSLPTDQTVVENIWNVFIPKGIDKATFCGFCFAKYDDFTLLYKCSECDPPFYVCGDCNEFCPQHLNCDLEIFVGEVDSYKFDSISI